MNRSGQTVPVTGAARVVDDEDGDAQIGAWTLVGLGGFIVGCVVLGLVIGSLADSHWGSSPVGILVGLGVGIVVALVGSGVQIAGYLRR